MTDLPVGVLTELLLKHFKHDNEVLNKLTYINKRWYKTIKTNAHKLYKVKDPIIRMFTATIGKDKYDLKEVSFEMRKFLNLDPTDETIQFRIIQELLKIYPNSYQSIIKRIEKYLSSMKKCSDIWYLEKKRNNIFNTMHDCEIPEGCWVDDEFFSNNNLKIILQINLESYRLPSFIFGLTISHYELMKLVKKVTLVLWHSSKRYKIKIPLFKQSLMK